VSRIPVIDTSARRLDDAPSPLLAIRPPDHPARPGAAAQRPEPGERVRGVPDRETGVRRRGLLAVRSPPWPAECAADAHVRHARTPVNPGATAPRTGGP